MLLGQGGLEAILRTALAEHGCSVELGNELRSFQQFDERVDAILVKVGKYSFVLVGEVLQHVEVSSSHDVRGADA